MVILYCLSQNSVQNAVFSSFKQRFLSCRLKPGGKDFFLCSTFTIFFASAANLGCPMDSSNLVWIMSKKRSLFYIFGLGVASGISLQSPKQAEIFRRGRRKFRSKAFFHCSTIKPEFRSKASTASTSQKAEILFVFLDSSINGLKGRVFATRAI
jgi:hypothetical protein